MADWTQPHSIPFVYRPLAYDDSIRLLEIQPSGNLNAELRCVLKHVQLSENPVYEALSYAWGDPIFPGTLFVRNHSRIEGPKALMASFSKRNRFQKHLKITQNLDLALRRYRLPDTARTLWADALCINQNDLDEREKQVVIMSKIYTQCSRTLVFLGEGDDRVYQGIDAIRRLGSIPIDIDTEDSDSFNLMRDKWSALDPEAPMKQSVASAIRPLVISGFFDLPWFCRLWIVQEAVLPACVVLRYGTEEVDWPSLEKAVLLLRTPQEFIGRLPFALYSVAALLFERSQYRQRPIIQEIDLDIEDLYMSQIRHSKRLCTDDRDRIYAVMGIHPAASKVLIDVDYRKPAFAVYTDFTRKVIESTNLNILTEAGLWRLPNTMVHIDENSNDCPSWVLDHRKASSGLSWEYMWKSDIDDYFEASPKRSFALQWPESHNRLIRLSGTRLDAFGALMMWEQDPDREAESLFEYIYTCWNECKKSFNARISIDLDSTEERFADVIVGGARSRSHPTDLYYLPHLSTEPPNRLALNYLRSYCNFRQDSLQNLVPPGIQAHHLYPRFSEGEGESRSPEMVAAIAYVRALSRVASQCSFFTTKNGRFGLAPCEVLLDDIVAMIQGFPTPLILRPAPTEGQYQLVGSCYIPGCIGDEYVLPDGELENFDLV